MVLVNSLWRFAGIARFPCVNHYATCKSWRSEPISRVRFMGRESLAVEGIIVIHKGEAKPKMHRRSLCQLHFESWQRGRDVRNGVGRRKTVIVGCVGLAARGETIYWGVMGLPARILLALVVAATCGIVAAYTVGSENPSLVAFIHYVTQPVGQIYLRLLFMLIIPLVFSALSLGIVEVGELSSLGRIGAKTLAYTVVVSAIAVALGVGVVNVFRPGEHLSEAARQTLIATASQRAGSLSAAAVPRGGVDLLVQVVPDNFFKAATSGDMLAVMFFSLMFGIALAMTKTDAASKLRETIQGLYDVTLWLIHLILKLTPIGVGALVFTITAQLGYDILVQLTYYVVVVVGALAVHQFVVYSLSVKFFGGMSPIRFFKCAQEAMLTAFSTASSNAALPTTLKIAEEKLGVPPHIGRFVLTIGSTANQNGTALFEGVSALFLAQLYGVQLSLSQQILVVLVCVLGGIGTAGVPAGSLPVVAMILGMVGVPVEGIGVILGVDRFLDMCRTTLNVTGDLAAAVVIAHSEAQRGDAKTGE